MEAALYGPVLRRDGSTDFYGAIQLDDKIIVLDDPVLLDKEPNAKLYRLHTVSKHQDDPAVLEFVRLYRPTEIDGGALPYHAEKEVLFSNHFEERHLEDLKFCEPFTLHRRNAFLLLSSFPPNVYFYQNPEYYWVDCPFATSSPTQVQEKPSNLNCSPKRKSLPTAVINRAYNLRNEILDEDTDSQTSPTLDSEGSFGKSKMEVDLRSEDSLLMDLEKSNGEIAKNRKRLRRMSSEAGVFGETTEDKSPSIARSTDLIPRGDTQPVIDLSMDDNMEEDIESPPRITTPKGKAMWHYESEDCSVESRESSRDKDNWLTSHIGKQKKGASSPAPVKRDGGDFRASLLAATTESSDSKRSSKLARESTSLNNYAEYATDDGLTTTSPPQSETPKRPSSISSGSALKMLSSPSNRRQFASGMACIDSDEEKEERPSSPVDYSFSSPSKPIVSSPSGTPEGTKKGTVATWRPSGPRQTTISFPKATPNGLDSAVLATGSASPSKMSKDSKPSQTPSSTKKKKAIMPLQIDGMAPVDATTLLMSQAKNRSKKVTTHPESVETTTSPMNKKRARTEVVISDESDEDRVFSTEIGVLESGPHKLRKLSPPQFEEPGARSLGKSGQKSKRREEEEEEDGTDEMKGFIVSDDDEIEYDTKTRFVDEEPTDPKLGGYLRDSSSLNMESQGSNLSSSFADRRREFLGEFASLDLTTAFKRYLQYLVSSVINISFASTWRGKNSRSDTYFTPALHKVIDRVNSVKNSLLASSVWNEHMKEAIETHPDIHEAATSSDGVQTTCQACRRKHVATHILYLTGVPYDAEAFWNGVWIDNPPEETEEDQISFRAGSTCSKRIIAFHKLHHLQLRLVEKIRPRVDKARETYTEEQEILKAVLDTEAWVENMTHWFETTIESYTEFGLRAGTRTAPSDDIILDHE